MSYKELEAFLITKVSTAMAGQIISKLAIICCVLMAICTVFILYLIYKNKDFLKKTLDNFYKSIFNLILLLNFAIVLCVILYYLNYSADRVKDAELLVTQNKVELEHGLYSFEYDDELSLQEVKSQLNQHITLHTSYGFETVELNDTADYIYEKDRKEVVFSYYSIKSIPTEIKQYLNQETLDLLEATHVGEELAVLYVDKKVPEQPVVINQ